MTPARPAGRPAPARSSDLLPPPGIPVPPEGTIGRARVESLLDQGLGSRLTVVCAGPGWGKTTAVASWLSTGAWSGRPVAWLTAHPGSDDPATFWEAVVDAVRQTGAVPDDHPLTALSGAAGFGAEVLASLLRGLDSLATDVLLVLDDFHEVSNPQVLDALATVVRTSPRVRLIVLTRTTPRLPRHQLRLTGGLTDLTAQDLALDEAEVVELARGQGLAISCEQAADLLAKTEGWPVGVRLALLHAARHDLGSLLSFAGSERTVAEYLLAEILERNTPQVRDFLLRTSVAPRVCADLAESIVPGAPAQQILELLEGRNEFVTALGPDRAWYRYHPLLRDLLLHSLHRDDPVAARAAHQAAARWWSAHGDPVQGLRHASDAEDWGLFAEVFVQAAGPSLVGSRREALGTCLRAVPFETLPASVESHLMQAGLAVVDGRGAAVRQHCGAAQESLRQGGSAAPAALAMLELLTLAGHRFAGAPAAALEAGNRALAVLDASDPFPAQRDFRLVATHNLGVAHFWEGDVDTASRCFTAVLDWGPGGAELAHFGAECYLALARAAQGELTSAGTAAESALATAASRGWSSLMQARAAHLASALLHLLRGDWHLADAAISAALSATRGGSEPPATLWLHCLQAEIAVSQERTRAGQHAVRAARSSLPAYDAPDLLVDVVDHALTEVALLTPGESIRWVQRPRSPATTVMRASCQARLLLAHGDHAGARRLASQVAEQYQAGGPEGLLDLLALVEAYLVIALVNDHNLSTDASLAALGRALDLARPHRMARPFLVTRSPRMAVLLQQSMDRQPDPFAEDLVCRLAAEEGGPTTEPGRGVPALTERELAMLAALPSMKSNAQIADDFSVSVNTVKAHLKGLYRKLDVSSRREAVERARNLGVLR